MTATRSVKSHSNNIERSTGVYVHAKYWKVICGTPCVVQTEEQTEDIDTPLGIKPTYPRFATHSIYQRTRLVSVAGVTLAAHTGLTLLPTLLP
jgi:hypothetical protein